jgi:hypothetical protein
MAVSDIVKWQCRPGLTHTSRWSATATGVAARSHHHAPPRPLWSWRPWAPRTPAVAGREKDLHAPPT